MGNPIPEGRLTNPRRLPFRDIFAAMHSNDDHILGVPFFDLPQLRKDVDTVDSAVGPEVEKDYLPAQARQRQSFAAGMNPVEPGRELWRANTR